MSFMIYLDILYFGKFMLAFVPKMVRCEWILVDVLEWKSPPPQKKEKNFRFKKVLGIELLTLLTLLGCAF